MEHLLFGIGFISAFLAVVNYASFSRSRNILYFKISHLNEQLNGTTNKEKYILKRRFNSKDTYYEVHKPAIIEENMCNVFYSSSVDDLKHLEARFRLLNVILISVMIISVLWLLIENPAFLKSVFENDSYD